MTIEKTLVECLGEMLQKDIAELLPNDFVDWSKLNSEVPLSNFRDVKRIEVGIYTVFFVEHIIDGCYVDFVLMIAKEYHD